MEQEQEEAGCSSDTPCGGGGGAHPTSASAIDKTKFLDFHLYFTSALQRTDMRAVGLQLAMDLLHKKVN